jgi:hypothetical protein
MGMLGYLLFPWGVILQAIAIVHFIRRRPDTYWLWVIIIFGWLGAAIYIFAEMVPDLGLLRSSFQGFSRRKRIQEVEAIIHDNPSSGNYEELGDLYFDEQKFARAKDCYDKAITNRTDHPDPFYRRGNCEIVAGDYQNAIKDLEKAVSFDRKHDYFRALGLLAHAYACTGETAKAEPLFAEATQTSTLSETQYNYALFLSRNGEPGRAREWLQQILSKKVSLPRYLKRRERPWFRRASALLKQLPAGQESRPNA